MPSAVVSESGFHPGEVQLHQKLAVPEQDNPTIPFLPPQLANFIYNAPLIAVSTIDKNGKPWASLIGGKPGFAMPLGNSTVALQSSVPFGDPIVENFGDEWDDVSDGEDGEKTNGEGMIAGLAINIEHRRRIKFAGRADRKMRRTEEGKVGFVMFVDESLGNCPKYINTRHLEPAPSTRSTLAENPNLPIPLPEHAINLINKADMFFIASRNEFFTSDVNIRGGPAGFVRVIQSENSTTLVYPEYSGNRLYQTLGNLAVTPLAGITFPDWETGDVLWVTGTTEILVGKEAESILDKTNLAVKITITEAKFSAGGLGLRSPAINRVGWSPYNPAVRYLKSEPKGSKAIHAPDTSTFLKILKSKKLSEDILRVTFEIDDRDSDITWKAGQYVAMDFSGELDAGYRHMDDQDPKGLNDDYIRSFTISSPPEEEASSGIVKKKTFDITVRRNGPVTNLLFRSNENSGLEVKFLGIGGEFYVDSSAGSNGKIGIVAGGVGITPFLAQWKAIHESKADVEVLWSVKGKDLPFVKEILEREDMKGFAERVRLFVTGKVARENIDKLPSVREAVNGRITKDDVEALKDEGRKWYVCAVGEMMKIVVRWLEGSTMTFEDFSY